MNNSGNRERRFGIAAAALVLVSLLPATLPAQNAGNPPLRPGQGNAANAAGAADPAEAVLPPIECWWKTDRSAVRVGETFLLTLTCAVLDTERVKVVVDESGLAPSALHLTPFDIVGGERFRDIRYAPRRFFQYQYSMRVLGEEFFGKEITLPRLQLTYRVQNSLQGGASLQGRETQYSLVPVPLRVQSLVPAGAADIRDTPIDTFGDVEARLFRSNLLLILAGVAFVLAGLMAVMLVARAAVKRQAATVTRPRVISPGAALRAASRKLNAVRAASQNDGWNADLAGRATAAVRLAGAVALSRPIGHRDVVRDTPPGEGQVLAAPWLGVFGGRRTALSAAVTPDSTALNGSLPSAMAAWRPLKETLRAFSTARYSRGGSLDGTALDAALAEGQDAVRRLRMAQWRRFGRPARHAEAATARQTWAR
jgi:hypothetical protein